MHPCLLYLTPYCAAIATIVLIEEWYPSPSTLQKLWSYNVDDNSQSFHVENLNLCVKVFGYATWQEFSDSVANKDEEVFDPYAIDAKK